MTRDMAQHVIDTIKPTVRHNINIMDSHGVIIAAVDPERVGTHHAGALDAVVAQEPVEIWDRDDTSGVRPGVNIPLWYDGAVRGVVGLTGNPDDVRSTAELIALTVELLLTQERQIDDDMQRETLAHDFIAALSSGATDEELLTTRISALSMHPPWTLAVELTIDPSDPMSTVPPATSRGQLRRLNRAKGVVVAELYGAVWTVRSGAAKSPKTKPVQERLIALPATTSIKRLQAQAVMLRHACAFPGLFPAMASSVENVESADAVESPGWRWEIASAVAHMPRAAVKDRAESVEALTLEQCLTVLALGEHSSTHAAAVGLYIHRNTMAQRVEQIVNRTGYDPRIGADLTALLMGVYARAAVGDVHIFGR